MHKKTLADVLQEQGVLTGTQLEQAVHAAHEQNHSLSSYLTQYSLVTSEQLAQAYAVFAGVPYCDAINDKQADPSLLARVPFAFLRDNGVIPIKRDGATAFVVADPTNFSAVDDLAVLFSGAHETLVAPLHVIIDAINRYYPLEGTKQMMADLEEDQESVGVDFAEIEEQDILGMASDAPIIKLVNHILFQAVKRDASDIHIEPYEKELSVRYRIDGVMYPVFTPPKRVQGALSSRIKIMANLNIAEKRKPQDGRIQIKVADRPFDIRVSILPVAFGERVVMRILDKSKTFVELASLGFSEHDHTTILESIERPNGIIYVSGPTGSGKTSTLYSILSRLNSPEVNIMTVEDPVEYQMNGVAQIQVKEKIGLTFASALRSMLRQDPDIIMIGETRDQETAQIAIQSALTGHLVLSTIHTNDAPSTITRLLDMGIEAYLIASSLVSVVAQRLVRRLCDYCKQPYTPDQELLDSLGVPLVNNNPTFYKAVGCQECSLTGYKGRLALFEVMSMTDSIARLTMERADTSQVRAEAMRQGMHLLVQDGIAKVEKGQTSIDEVLSVASKGTIEPAG